MQYFQIRCGGQTGLIDQSDFLKFCDYWLMDVASLTPAGQPLMQAAAAAVSMPSDRRNIEVVSVQSAQAAD
jgi:hypothetical protein